MFLCINNINKDCLTGKGMRPGGGLECEMFCFCILQSQDLGCEKMSLPWMVSHCQA